MKRWFTVAAVVVLCLALVIGIACGGEEGEDEGVTELKFGVGLPLSGVWGAVIGVATKTAMGIAADDIGVFEVAGKEYRWKLYYQDNAITADGGLASATKLIYENGVDFMAQATDISAIGASTITEEIPMLLEAYSSSKASVGPHTFASIQAWEGIIPALVKWLVTEHPEIKVFVTAQEETPSGESTTAVYRAACEHYGLEYHSVVTWPGTVEWYPVATKIMSYDPDVVVGGGGGTGLYEAMWDMGYEGFCLGSVWDEAMARTPGWDRMAEENRFGKGYIFFGLHPYAGAFPNLEAFADEYERRSGMEIGMAAAWVLNPLYYWTDILQQAGTVDDVEKILETMEGGTFDTPAGQMHFGLGDYAGVPHIGVWPVPIFEIVGEREYVVHKIYTADEAEAIFLEAWAAK